MTSAFVFVFLFFKQFKHVIPLPRSVSGEVNCYSYPCPLYVMCVFIWLLLILPLYLWFSAVCLGCLWCDLCICIYPVWGSLLLGSAGCSLKTKFGMSLHIIFSKRFPPISLSSPSDNPITHLLYCHRPLTLYFLLIFFSLCSLDWIVSVDCLQFTDPFSCSLQPAVKPSQ